MAERMKPKAAGTGRALFPLTWPQSEFPTQTMADWFGAQQKMLAAMVQLAQESIAIAHKQTESGSGILTRMMAARTPEELIACQRDLFELMSANYFEQMMKLGEQMRDQLVKETGAATKSADPLMAEKKAA